MKQYAEDKHLTRDYTDPLAEGSKGKFVWLNDMLVYVKPNGKVYILQYEP